MHTSSGIKRVVFAILAAAIVITCYIPAKGLTTKIRVAYDCNMPPYQFTDDQGNAAGMHVEILDQIARRNDLVLEYIAMERASDCMEHLNSGDVDLVLGAMMEERRQEQMTDEMSSSTLCLVVKKDFLDAQGELPDLAGEMAVFEYGTASYSLISKIGASMYVAVGNQREVFRDHMGGGAKAIIGIKDSILWQLNEMGVEDQYIIANNYMSTVRYGILTQKGDHDLKRILNRGLVELRASGEYDKIFRSWIVEEAPYDTRALVRRSICVIGVVVLFWFVYAAVNQRIKAILKKQVEEKTRELQEANTELERQIVQIREANDMQRYLVENSPNGMVLFDRDFTVRAMNNSAARLAWGENAGGVAAQAGVAVTQPGVPPARPSGEAYRTYPRLTDIPFFKNLLDQLGDSPWENDTGRLDRAVTIPGGASENHTYQCSVIQAPGADAQSGILLTILDITKEEQEKRLAFEKEKSKAMNRLIAGIAHEIKNPLMSIRTFANLITTRRGDQQVQDMFAEFVPDEVDRINKLVEGLINYAKPTQKQVTSIDLGNVINECMYLTQAVVKQGRIQVEVRAEEGLLIRGDQTQIKQVLINIILNSIESMEKKMKEQSGQASHRPVLTIEAKGVGSQAVIIVEDEGCGMTEKEIRRCTDPFFTTKTTGTGLGLALSKNYLEENGGCLLIESKLQEYTRITMKFDRRAPGDNCAVPSAEGVGYETVNIDH